jgi:hypothetical protein
MATPIPAISTRDLRAALVRTVLPPKDAAVTSRQNGQTPITPHVVEEGYLADGTPERTEPYLEFAILNSFLGGSGLAAQPGLRLA